MINRQRFLLVLAATLLCVTSLPIAHAASDDEIKLTFLGTGAPRPSHTRYGPAILVEAGETDILIDVGRGAIQRLFQIGAARQIADIDMVLFTHLHSDHVVGFPDFWLTGWVFGRDRPLPVMGPPGTRAMCDHLDQAFAFDKKVRGRDDRYVAAGVELEVRDVPPSLRPFCLHRRELRCALGRAAWLTLCERIAEVAGGEVGVVVAVSGRGAGERRRESPCFVAEHRFEHDACSVVELTDDLVAGDERKAHPVLEVGRRVALDE